MKGITDDLIKQSKIYSSEKLAIRIGGEKVVWKDMKVEITSGVGEHTMAKLRYVAPLQQESLYNRVIEDEEDTEVLITGRSNISEPIIDSRGNREEVEGSKIFLNGIIEDLSIYKTSGSTLIIEMLCVSKSILLDRIPRYRSFQDPGLGYVNIVEEVNKSYMENESTHTGLVVIGEGLDKVPRMTIQYNETDWEYIKRIASYIGEPVVPYVDKVVLGFLREKTLSEPVIKYSYYGLNKHGKRRSFKVKGNEIYTVSTPIKLKKLGEEGEVIENDYFVIRSRIYNKGNMLKCEYELGKQSDYFVDPIPHEKIRGAIVEGRVIHIARTDESKSDHGRTDGSSDNLEGRTIGDKPLNRYIEKSENKNQNKDVKEKVKRKDIAVMTLDLTEGLMELGESGQSFEDKYAGKSYFPYVTPYSQSNTGFTPAPEENDRVALYFPNGNETKAFVIGALNNDGNGRFTDVANRNYHVGDSDFNMVLAKDSLYISAASSISQNASSISENAKSISNNAEHYSEKIDGTKSILAQNIEQMSTVETNIGSTGNTNVTAQGTSKVAGGKNVLING